MSESLELLNVQELAQELKVPASWIYGQTRKKDPNGLPCLRFGKYYKFRKTDVLDWAERQAKVSMTD